MPRLLILEGWFLGVRAQGVHALTTPINALERDEDANGGWRQRANQCLPDYLPLWHRADQRVLLQMPDWAYVRQRREQAEQGLRERHAPHAMNKAQLNRFLQHYERIGRHALAHPPAATDWIMPVRRQSE